MELHAYIQRFPLPYFFSVTLLAVVYFVTGKLGFSLTAPPDYATAIWPPSGIALATLLAFGLRLWPGVFIGSFILHVLDSYDPTGSASYETLSLVSALIAAGATLQAFVGALVVRRFVAIPNPLEQARDIGYLILFGGPISCIISATTGILTLLYVSGMPRSEMEYSWLTWWVGDSIGVIVFTPILLLLFSPRLAVTNRRRVYVGISLTIAFFVAVCIFMNAVKYEEQKQRAEFERKASYLAEQVNQRLYNYVQVLFSISRLYVSSEFVTAGEFHTFVTKLFEEYPGLNSIVWRKRVSHTEREQYEAEMRLQTGNPDFTITERVGDTDKFIISPPRSEYFPSTYIEFPDKRKKNLGRDSYDVKRKEALDVARDSGNIAITDRISIFRGDRKFDAAVLYRPVYDSDITNTGRQEKRAHLKGVITASFVFPEMLADVIGRAEQEKLYIALVDVNNGGINETLYNSESSHDSKSSLFEYSKSISIGTQSWDVRVSSMQDYGRHNFSTWLILTGGLAFTGLFGAFLLLVTGQTDIVHRLVDEKTQALKRQQEELRASEETFRSAMEYASIGMALVDTSGKWLKVNKAICNLLGYTEEEMLGGSFQSVTHPDDLEADLENIRKTLAGEIKGYEMEKRYFRKDGRIVWVLLSVTLLRNTDGTPRYFISQIQDITERRQIDIMKREFISIVSHELRTPLTSIRGSLGLIEGTMSKDLPAKLKNLISIAHKNSERLILLINDILDMDKLAAGKMRFDMKNENLADLITLGIETNSSYADKYRVSFICEPIPSDIYVNVDANRWQQVFANLLSNAAKFSPEGGTVRIACLQHEGRVKVSVIDRGSGIPEEFRPRIFGKFSQADSTMTRTKGGTGLGLNISKEIMGQMNGEIGFDTELGKGTTFWFEMPVVAVNENDTSSVVSGRKHILVCEDDDLMGSFIRQTLEKVGYNTDIARTIPEAKRKLAANDYSAMTLDIGLPMGDGLQFLHGLRSLPETKNLPVVIVSAKANEHRKTAFAGTLDVADWLSKPFDARQLTATLTHALSHAAGNMPRVLFIEDDMDLMKMLSAALRGRAELVPAKTLREAEEALQGNSFALIILDVALPDGSGISLLDYIRATTDGAIPVLILSAREMPQEIQDKVASAIVKSRVSEEKIVNTILSYVEKPFGKNAATGG